MAIQCASCGTSLKPKTDLAGKKVRCPKCGTPLSVPASAVAPTQPPPVSDCWNTMAPRDRIEPADAVNELTAATVAPSGGTADSQTDGTINAEAWDFLAPAQQPDELGRLGNYRILKVLGAGGMGVVFQAEDMGLKRLVAIKAMRPALAASSTAKQRFVREAQTAAALEHDHIVPIFQVGEDRGVPFIAMPFLKGEPLDVRLERDKTLPIPELLRIGRETARGLAAAHAAGLVHRDIKPANLWLEAETGRVKVLDFGLARSAVGDTQLTQQGAVIGTPAYMAPEQAAGQTLDARCDLFSLGCVLYRAAVGEAPFKGSDMVATLVAVATVQPPAPSKLRPQVPPALSDLILKLLAKKPDGRPASAQAVAETLLQLEQQPAVTAVRPLPRPAEPTPKPKTPVSRTERPPPPRTPPRRAPQPKSTPLVVWLIAAATTIVGLAVVAAAGIFVFWPTANGTVRIESDDPNVLVAFHQDGATITGADRQPITLRAGEHGVHVKRGDLEFQTDSFLLKKNDTVTLRITVTRDKLEVTADGKLLAARALPVAAAAGPAKGPKETPKEALSPRPKDEPATPPGGTIAGWGTVVDPAGDTTITATEGRLTLAIPAAHRDLWPGVGPANAAPRVMQEIEGDFSVQVKVASVLHAKLGSTLPGLGDNGAFQAGGLLIWKNPKTFVRLERVSRDESGRLVPLCWLEAYQNGKPAVNAKQDNVLWGQPIPDALTTLRLERRQARLEASFSQDGGKTWTPHVFGAFDMKLFGKLQVGVACVNNTRNPLKVDFQGLHITHTTAANPPTTPPPPPGPLPARFTNGVGMEFVLVGRGQARLGGVGGKPATQTVEISNDYYLGKHEVTHEDWRLVMGGNPSFFARKGGGKDMVKSVTIAVLKRLPVETVSWTDAQEFLHKLNQHEAEPGWTYRLPTGVEWEYACRDGPLGKPADSGFDFYVPRPSNLLLPSQANFAAVPPVGPPAPSSVGAYAPNRLGLCDMHGNVSEWCQDSQKGPDGNLQRLVRGGSWRFAATQCRAADRTFIPPSTRATDLGLRVVRVRSDLKQP